MVGDISKAIKEVGHINIWLDDDDNRIVPPNYIHCHSVNETIQLIKYCESNNIPIDYLDLDHDLGNYACDGGDGIKLLDWIEETGRYFKINLHTMNPVGRQNMIAIINKLKLF